MSSKKVEKLATVIVQLAEAFRQRVNENTIEGYRIGLEDLPIEAVQGAVSKAIRNCKFMPSCSELRELAGVLSVPDRALMAFVAFEKALGRHGTYKTLDFDDRAINATVRALGGLDRICDVPADEWVFLRKRFIDTYCAYVRAGVGEEAGLPCCGFFDRQNSAKGIETSNLERIDTGLPSLRGITGPPQTIVRIESDNEPKRIGQLH